MKIFKTSILSLALFASTITFAQETEVATEEPTAEAAPTFSVSGSVDTYFRSAEFAPNTSFAVIP